MDKLPQYYVGYAPEINSILVIRADASDRVSGDLQELFGGRASGLNFNIFANIQFMTRTANDFGRAFWVYVAGGQPLQIKAGWPEHQHVYALLSLVCADLIVAQVKDKFWPRVMAQPLAKNEDVANMLRGAGLIK